MCQLGTEVPAGLASCCCAMYSFCLQGLGGPAGPEGSAHVREPVLQLAVNMAISCT